MKTGSPSPYWPGIAFAVAGLFLFWLARPAAAQQPVSIGALPHAQFLMQLPEDHCLAEAAKSDYEREYIENIRKLLSPSNTLVALLLPCKTVADGRDDAVDEVARPKFWVLVHSPNFSNGVPTYRNGGRIEEALAGYERGMRQAHAGGKGISKQLREKADMFPQLREVVITDDEQGVLGRDDVAVYSISRGTKSDAQGKVSTMSIAAMTYLHGYAVQVAMSAPQGDRVAQTALLKQVAVAIRSLRNHSAPR